MRPCLARVAFVLLAVLSAGFCLAEQPALSPAEALKKFKVADGFEVKLVASEPAVRQPVTMTFDDRGRIWVIQYLQYPAPAGLSPVQVDQYLRTKYDRVPEPPPHGPKGADRVTILEDTDADGHMDRAKDFVGGLNLASALALGHGGVFVGQAPYLLFYPDRNGDDVPDGDPEVLLKGFGLEDAHAVVNSMQWGPDGWLYGTQGSTVTADIRGIGFQQGIWRYHPVTKKFELFSEGGGNTWGLDFDRHGNALAGTNFGDRVLLHQVQGAYFVKGFSKHGPLHNPYTYGYFEHAPHTGWRGGHVTCGGIVYEADSFPAAMRHSYVAANLLSNAVYWHSIDADRSTFKTAHKGELLTTDDIWFRPIDCLLGPDGSVYVADWYDKRANHVIPEDTWDRSNGRIWKIEAKGTKKAELFGLGKLTGEKLIELLSHRNDWYVREARRILGERRDASLYGRLRQLISQPGNPALSLQALWALYASGGWDEQLSVELLGHSTADVRTWAIRLLGDEQKVSPGALARLVALARSEPDPSVRSQLACTAKRLPGQACLAIAGPMLQHSEDQADPRLPLLIWWAIEDKAVSDRDAVLALVATPEAWKLPLVVETVAPRLARRYVAAGTDEGFAACAQLLAAAPSANHLRALIVAMEQEFAGRRLEKIPAALDKPLADLWKREGSDPSVIRFALRLGSQPAFERALELIADAKQPVANRVAFIEVVGQAGQAAAVPRLMARLEQAEPDAIRLAALAALEHFADAAIADKVLSLYAKASGPMRSRSISLLCSRKSWSSALLAAVEFGAVDPKEIPLDQLRRILLHKDEALNQLVEKRWGKVRSATPGEKTAQIVVLNRTINEGKGDPVRGQPLFIKHCGTCHTLFGEGNKVGPELTGADRKNRDLMLLNIVDPTNSVRPEFVAQTVLMNDGRLLSGLVVESTPQAITLLDAKNQRTVLARSDIDELQPAALSLMPEKILEPLSPQELRDLFSYLQSDGPVAKAGK